METTCSVDGCQKRAKSLGWCQTHYMRFRRHGRTDAGRKPASPTTLRDHFMYGSWAGMVNRCHNPNNSAYARYGAKGITVCDRWRAGDGAMSGFKCFLADMGERPEGMTLDRIDPTGPYAPENCRWATITEQRRNITIEGDKRMRLALSEGVKLRWRRERQARSAAGLPTGIHRSGKRFRAKIYADGKSHDLGTYATIEEAMDAYYTSARTICGEQQRR